MLRHPYDTPTFKTNMLHLVSNEGRVKRILLLYKQLIKPFLSLRTLAITGNGFPIFHLYDAVTFKTKGLSLVSNEGWVKHLLLLYKPIMQRYLSLLWL